MASAQAVRGRQANGPPRELTAGPPEGVPHGLVVAAAVTWRALLLAFAVLAAAWVAGKLLIVVVPVVVALLLTTLLSPLAGALRERGARPRTAAIVVLLAGIGLIALLLALVVPPFVSEAGKLGTSVEQGSREAGKLLHPLGISQDQVDHAVDAGVKSLQGSGGERLAGSAVTGALAALNVLAGVLLTLVLTFFFVKDGRVMWGWIAGLLGRHRATAGELGERIWATLTGYVQGIALVAVVDATLIGLALVILGVPLAMPLTVLTFLAAFFPVVGAVTIGLAAVLVALVAKGAGVAAIVAVWILVVQQLDGNVMQPLLVGRKLSLHPVVILLALTAGGVVAGLVGAFLAVPLAAVTATAIEYARSG